MQKQNSHKINVFPKGESVKTSNSLMPLLRVLGSCSAVTMGGKKFQVGHESTWVMREGAAAGKEATSDWETGIVTLQHSRKHEFLAIKVHASRVT